MSESPKTGTEVVDHEPQPETTQPQPVDVPSTELSKGSWFDPKSVLPLTFIALSFVLGGLAFTSAVGDASDTRDMKFSLSLYGIELKDDAAVRQVIDQCRDNPAEKIETRATFGGAPDRDIIIVCDPEDSTKVNTAAGILRK